MKITDEGRKKASSREFAEKARRYLKKLGADVTDLESSYTPLAFLIDHRVYLFLFFKICRLVLYAIQTEFELCKTSFA